MIPAVDNTIIYSKRACHLITNNRIQNLKSNYVAKIKDVNFITMWHNEV